MKNIIFIVIFIFINACGYKAVYKDNEKHNIKIAISKMSGNEEMNNLIKSELNSYFTTNSNKEFIIELKTNLDKKITTKDTTGKAEEFQLTLITMVNINIGDKKIKSSFNENFKMKNSSDTFELKKYEKIIKRNFARSIKDKLILKLISIQ